MLQSSLDSKFASAITIIFIGILLIDSLLSDISSLINQSLTERTGIILFSIIVIIGVLCSTKVIAHNILKIKSEFRSRKKVLFSVSNIIPFIQYSIIGLLLLITIEIIISSQYLVLLLVAALALSWSTGVILMGIMSFKFVQWYRTKRNLIVLLYLISSIMFCTTLGATIIPQLSITIQSSTFYVNSHSIEVKPFQANAQKLSILFAIISIANWLVIPLVFILWAATAFMLNHYSKIFGRTKYWAMLCAPLASFIIGVTSLLFLLPSLTSIFDQKAIPYTAMAFGGILTEGFLLAFAFVSISKSLQTTASSKVRDYLRISALGVAIVFVSFFANPSAASYLPYGALSASFFGFGAYLFFTGIYSSAISISSDISLRQTIRRSLPDHSKLLDNIGTANINKAIEQQIRDILKRHNKTIEDDIGIESTSSESDWRRFVNEIVDELKIERQRKSSNEK